MEEYAALKASRKREERDAILRKQKEDELKGINKNKMTKEQEIAWKSRFGYPSPPAAVYAAGRVESAAVWWPWNEELEANPDTKISKWIVHRYRRDNAHSPWLNKGKTEFTKLEKKQVLIGNLTNGYQYAFTLQVINSVGMSVESHYSNPVFVDSELPSGWFRFFDTKKQKFYYANLKTKKSSWTRPELDKYFLDESILFNFNDAEIEHCKDLFIEDMEHFTYIDCDQLISVLLEVGEKMPKSRVIKLVRGYTQGKDKITTWAQFMSIMNHIKVKKMTPTIIIPLNPAMIVARQIASSLLNVDKEKMGDWKVEFSSIANRDYYLNTKTNETRWEMPDDIRFFIPSKLEDKLMTVFDFGHIEAFKQHFSMLDIDGSGDLTDRELKLLFAALKINCDDTLLNKLIQTVDLNGNGTIEFDEFCWMMYTLADKQKVGVWKELLEYSADNKHNKLIANSIVDVSQISKNLMSHHHSLKNEKVEENVIEIDNGHTHLSKQLGHGSHLVDSNDSHSFKARGDKDLHDDYVKLKENNIQPEGENKPVLPLRELLILYYKEINTAKIDEVNRILRKYKNRVSDLVYALEDKYGAATINALAEKYGWLIDAIDDAIDDPLPIRDLLILYYKELNTDKLSVLDRILRKYRNRAVELVYALEEKYGKENVDVLAEKYGRIPDALMIYGYRPKSKEHNVTSNNGGGGDNDDDDDISISSDLANLVDSPDDPDIIRQEKEEEEMKELNPEGKRKKRKQKIIPHENQENDEYYNNEGNEKKTISKKGFMHLFLCCMKNKGENTVAPLTEEEREELENAQYYEMSMKRKNPHGPYCFCGCRSL